MLFDRGSIGRHFGTRASLCKGGSAQNPGQRAIRYAIEQADGTQGYSPEKADGFHVEVVNHLKVPTSIHWHGLVLPNPMEGVPFVTMLGARTTLSF